MSTQPRPGLGNDTSLPPCQEYVEDNPRLQVSCDLVPTLCNYIAIGRNTKNKTKKSSLRSDTLQAVVSLMSGGGVGVGDRLDTLDTDLVGKT